MARSGSAIGPEPLTGGPWNFRRGCPVGEAASKAAVRRSWRLATKMLEPPPASAAFHHLLALVK